MVAPPPRKKPKRVHPWRNEYVREFGTRVVERDASTGDVLLVECRFCAAFGREARDGGGDNASGATPPNSNGEQRGQPTASAADSKTSSSSSSSSSSATRGAKKSRARTRSIATWKKSFRTDNMRSHHLEQHPRKWQEYQQLLALVKKEQALHGFANSSDGGQVGSESVEGRGEMFVYSQRLDAFFGDPSATAERFSSSSASQASTPTHQRKSLSRRSVAGTSQREDEKKQGLAEAVGSQGEAVALTEITNTAIVDELVAKLLDATTSGDGEGYAARVAGSSSNGADVVSGELQQNHSRTSPSDASTVLLVPIYASDARSSPTKPSKLRESVDRSARGVVKYGISIRNVKEFSYVRQLLGRLDATDFDQISKIVDISRSHFHLENTIARVSPADIRAYAKVAIAMDLQMISHTMRTSWTYSLSLQNVRAVDDDMGDSVLDIRIRIPSWGGVDVKDFHVVAVPLVKVHPFPEAAAAFISDTLSVLDPQWRRKMIGGCVEGSVQNMEVASTVLDRIAGNTTAPFYRSWHGALLVESALQKSLDELQEGVDAVSGGEGGAPSETGFTATLETALGYIRGERRWIQSQGTCPTTLFVHSKSTSLRSPWLLLRTLKWLVTRRESIGQLYAETHPPARACLTSEWWLVCLALTDLLSDFESIASVLGDMTQRSPVIGREILAKFVHDQVAKLGISQVESSPHRCPVSPDARFHVGDDFLQRGPFRWKKDKVVAYFRSLNLSTRRLYTQMSPREQATVRHQVSRFVLHSLHSVSELSETERADHRGASGLDELLLPTRPLDFVGIERDAVVDFIERHSARLELSYDMSSIDAISKEINELREMVSADATLKTALVATSSSKSSFREAWGSVEGLHFTRMLAAGFATAIPASRTSEDEVPSIVPSSFRETAAAIDGLGSNVSSLLSVEARLHACQSADVENTHKAYLLGGSLSI